MHPTQLPSDAMRYRSVAFRPSARVIKTTTGSLPKSLRALATSVRPSRRLAWSANRKTPGSFLNGCSCFLNVAW